MLQINVTQNKQKNNTKTVGENHAYVQGVGWAIIEVNDRRENKGINTILQKVNNM